MAECKLLLILLSFLPRFMTRPVDASYYKMMGVDVTASTTEIQKAFRKLSMKYHPDKNPDMSEKYKELTFAYETLSDPYKRKVYDQVGVGYHLERGDEAEAAASKKPPKERTQLLEFQGCFDNNVPDRIDTSIHLGCAGAEVCASLAFRVGKVTFGLSNPQKCQPGQSECFWLDSVPSLPNVSQELCKHELMIGGRFLGGKEHIAVYAILPDEWDWQETETPPDEEMIAEKNLQEQEKINAEHEEVKAKPWLFTPEVLKAKQKVESLQEMRRGANANFDMEMSAKITKQINEAERELQKLTKKAKKAHKKGSKAAANIGKSEPDAARSPQGEL